MFVGLKNGHQANYRFHVKACSVPSALGLPVCLFAKTLTPDLFFAFCLKSADEQSRKTKLPKTTDCAAPPLVVASVNLPVCAFDLDLSASSAAFGACAGSQKKKLKSTVQNTHSNPSFSQPKSAKKVIHHNDRIKLNRMKSVYLSRLHLPRRKSNPISIQTDTSLVLRQSGLVGPER